MEREKMLWVLRFMHQELCRAPVVTSCHADDFVCWPQGTQRSPLEINKSKVLCGFIFQLEKGALRSAAAPEMWLCRMTGMSLAKLHMDVPPPRRGESLTETQEIRAVFIELSAPCCFITPGCCSNFTAKLCC